MANDVHKQLRYTLGKEELAKYGRAEFADVCGLYLASKDVMTQGTGLDIYRKGQFSSLIAKVCARNRGCRWHRGKEERQCQEGKKNIGREDAEEEKQGISQCINVTIF